MIYAAAIFFYATASPEAALKNALAQAETAHNPQLIERAVLNLAQFFQEQSRYAEAEPLYKRSNDFNLSTYGSSSRPAALSLLRLGTFYHVELRFAEAETLTRCAAELLHTLDGPESLTDAYAIANLAAVLADRGQHTRAEPVLRRAIYLFQKHAESTTTLEINLGLIYLRQGEFRRAQTTLEIALAADPAQPSAYAALAELAIAEHRWADAGFHLRRAIDLEPSQLFGILRLKALIESHAANPAAVDDMKRSIELLEAIAGPESPTLATFLADYASILRHAKHPTEAKAALRRAKSLSRNVNQLTVPQ